LQEFSIPKIPPLAGKFYIIVVMKQSPLCILCIKNIG
jgi:hypothetical protein